MWVTRPCKLQDVFVTRGFLVSGFSDTHSAPSDIHRYAPLPQT